MTVLGLVRAGPYPVIDGLLDAIAHSAAELGMTSRRVDDLADEASVDVMLYVGDPRSYGDFLPATRRSCRIAWFGEMLPRSAVGDTQAARLAKGPAVLGLRIARPILGPLTRHALPGPIGMWREELATANARNVNLGLARWCAGFVDRMVVTSRDRGQVLGDHGLAARVVPFGYHPSEAGLIVAPGGERDIAVAILGNGLRVWSSRRARIVGQLVPAIERLGPVVLVEGVWGQARDSILRRTRIVLDVQNAAGNFGGLRFLTTLAAGAALVTDTIDDPYPFQSGIDHVEAPVDGLVAAIAALLGDEPRRRAMVEAGQARLLDDLSMRCSLERVLAA